MNNLKIKATIARLNRERRREIPATNIEGKRIRRVKSAYQLGLESKLKRRK